MTARRLLAAVAAIVVLLVLVAGPASAGALVDRAAEALRRDPVFVDDAAQSRTSVDAEQIRERIRKGGQPVFVAVLPEAAADEEGGDPTKVAAALGQATGLQGTYAVLVGTRFRAASNSLPRGTVGTLATAAFQRSRAKGTTAVLLDFVDRVNESAGGASPGSGQDRLDGSEGSGGSSGGGGASLLLPLLLLGAVGGGGGYLFWRKRKKDRELTDAREGLRPYLQMLADDVLALEPDVELHPDARGDYDAAVSRYRAADAAIDQMRSMDQVERLRRVLAEGNYAMARVRARVDGREPPPPPPELSVPGPNQEPAVVVDERGEPAYAGYGGGWYGGGGWFGGGD
ncbi:MAG: hypothetical protein M3N28_06875, partial [Actinomycetota bacterium]|nr:hypothetical protein [Actinomycetota bacterium]